MAEHMVEGGVGIGLDHPVYRGGSNPHKVEGGIPGHVSDPTGERNPGIASERVQGAITSERERRASRDFSSVDSPGNAGAGPREVLSAGKGYFGPHGTGTELNKSGYDVGQYAADHAVPAAGQNMAPRRTP